jgi:hypothetical protein
VLREAIGEMADDLATVRLWDVGDKSGGGRLLVAEISGVLKGALPGPSSAGYTGTNEH